VDATHIRVAIVNDHLNTGKKLGKILQSEPDIQVLVETDLSGIQKVEEQKPDVILLDSRKAFTDSVETTETIVGKFEKTRVIVLTNDSTSTLLPLRSKQSITATLCRVGACFPLCQGCSVEELLAAIRMH
jgi:DNA-binding NarL/FixJ family response regulator